MQLEFPKLNYKLIASLLIVGFFIVLASLLYEKFPVFMDEALYSDIVNRFNHGLGFSTPLFKDFIPHVEKYSYWYPPVYFLLLAPIYQIFGASITVGRLFSLVCATTALIIAYFLAKKIFKHRLSAIVLLVLLVSDFYFQDAGIVERMEILTLVWGVLALLFHFIYLSSEKNIHNLISGILAGICLLTHPTAAIILGPIGLNLLFLKTKNFKQKLVVLVTFALPILIGLLVWMASFWQNLDIFLLQNKVQIHRKEFAPLFVVETFKFKPLHRLVLLTYFISNFVFIMRSLINNTLKDAKTRIFFFLAFFSTLLPILMKEMWYLVFISFFGAIMLVKNLEYFWDKKFYWPLLGFLSLIVINCLIFFNTLNGIVTNPDNYWSFSEKIANMIPQNSSVLMASYPDPFFYFEKERPDLKLRVTPNNPDTEPIDPNVYNAIFSDVDYIILSFFLNQHIAQYINNNLEEVVYDNSQTGGYDVYLIKLKPVADREPLVISQDKQWLYND